MDIFRNMPIFVAVAQVRSFRQAAEHLDLPSSTVSRRIAELERDLGLRLFNRTTRRVELTESGQMYYESCRRLIQEAELAHQHLIDLQHNPKGVIRASLPVDLSVLYLPALLRNFARSYPGIQFELDITPSQADFVADRVDLALRIGQPMDPNAIACCIARFPAALFAAPGYLAGRGAPETPEDLLEHDCLRIRDTPWVLQHHASGQSRTLAVKGQFSANNPGLLRALALQGQGIVGMAEWMVATDVEQQHLVRVLPEWSLPAIPVYVMTATRLLPAKVRIFVDYLARELAGLLPAGVGVPVPEGRGDALERAGSVG